LYRRNIGSYLYLYFKNYILKIIVPDMAVLSAKYLVKNYFWQYTLPDIPKQLLE